MQRSDPSFHSRHTVGGCKTIVVMRMKIECLVRESVSHISHGAIHFCGAHYTQSIRQHEILDSTCANRLHETIHIIAVVAITIGPVFKIRIHMETLLKCVGYGLTNIFGMLSERFSQLVSTMFLAA